MPPDLITLALASSAMLAGLLALAAIVVREVRATSDRRAYVGHHHADTVEIVLPGWTPPTGEANAAVIEAVRA